MNQPAPETSPQVSVVIPCRNEVGHIAGLLDQIRDQQGLTTEPEIIVADGMSDDGTWELLQGYAERNPRLELIRNEGLIVSTGLNEAIRAASGEFIVRMDVHTRYADDYIAQCLAVATETGATNVGGAARTESTGRTQRAIAAAYGSRFAVGQASFHFPDYEGPVDTVTYGCWRRTSLLELGLFDEELVRNQDDELNLRTIRSGGIIWQSPRIRSWYRPRSSFRALFKQYFQYGFWKVAVIRKHRLPASIRHLVPGTFLIGLAALAFLSLGWPPARLLLATLGGAYLLFLVAGSLAVGRRAGWDLLPLLPLAFATFHSAYGLGFLKGLVLGRRGWSSPSVRDISR